MEKLKYLNMKGFLTFQILHELNGMKLCGDDLAEIIGSKKGSKLTPGTIYPALKYLRKKKLVTHKKIGRKRMYELTKEGKNEYKIFKENFQQIFKSIFFKRKIKSFKK